MKHTQVSLILSIIFFYACDSVVKESTSMQSYSNVHSIAAMKDVMWKGELNGKIKLDTIKNTKGLYGLGPMAFLEGEILINNGITYVSRVLSDSTMLVEPTTKAEAPFFVYANVNNWEKISVPKSVKHIKDLELFIDTKTKDRKRPFAFKLKSAIKNSIIHVQNLPKNTEVASPDEAHQGQVNFNLINEEVDIIGFFSTEHQGVFTHHDSFLHMHLITRDKTKMGHLDKVTFNDVTLFLPKS